VTGFAVPKSHVVPPCTQVGGTLTATPCAPSDRKWILIAITLGSALAFMDGSVVNVSLPTLQSTFHATSSSIQWVVQAYALFGAALLLLGAPLATATAAGAHICGASRFLLSPP
jgi:MFS family permease